MGINVDILTNSAYVVYVVVGYFVKFYILFYLLYVIGYLMTESYYYLCKSYVKVLKFFDRLVNPDEIDIFGFKFMDFFKVVASFIKHFIVGIIYFFIGLAILFACVLVSIPFNLIVSFQL